MTRSGPVTVLIVDDSAFDGEDALTKIEELDPMVVTLDVEMPRMDGITALRIIMERFPRPILMLSSLTQEGSRTTMQALELGAADFVGKPSGSVSLDFHKVRDELLQKIKAVSRNVNMRALRRDAHAVADSVSAARTAPEVDRPILAAGRGLVVIGCSTGGAAGPIRSGAKSACLVAGAGADNPAHAARFYEVAGRSAGLDFKDRGSGSD